MGETISILKAVPDDVFIANRDGKKWFAIGGKYTFKKEGRNEDEAMYESEVTIDLNGPLKAWLKRYTFDENHPPGKKKREQKDYQRDNPCLKRENTENFTIGIPKNAWLGFWGNVDIVSVRTRSGKHLTGSKQAVLNALVPPPAPWPPEPKPMENEELERMSALVAVAASVPLPVDLSGEF